MATTVRITETYDLKTTVNKMGLIGIHTPTDAQVRKLYPGLMKNHKFIRFLRCDVAGACASVLPADPLQVGISAGEVAPEDMFNPILYTATTNESFDVLVNRVYASAQAGALGSVTKDEPNPNVDMFSVYYSLLAENGRFKKSMPQAGFVIRGLVPICHTLISSFGNMAKIGNKTFDDGESNSVTVPELTGVDGSASGLFSDASDPSLHKAVVFRGRSVRMPKIPLHYGTEPANVPVQTNIPETYVCALVIPPARLHEFYYRMRVTWTIRFEGVQSVLPISDASAMVSASSLGYYKNYSYSKSESNLPEKSDTVDADGVEITKIMES